MYAGFSPRPSPSRSSPRVIRIRRASPPRPMLTLRSNKNKDPGFRTKQPAQAEALVSGARLVPILTTGDILPGSNLPWAPVPDGLGAYRDGTRHRRLRQPRNHGERRHLLQRRPRVPLLPRLPPPARSVIAQDHEWRVRRGWQRRLHPLLLGHLGRCEGEPAHRVLPLRRGKRCYGEGFGGSRDQRGGTEDRAAAPRRLQSREHRAVARLRSGRGARHGRLAGAVGALSLRGGGRERLPER